MITFHPDGVVMLPKWLRDLAYPQQVTHKKKSNAILCIIYRQLYSLLALCMHTAPNPAPDLSAHMVHFRIAPHHMPNGQELLDLKATSDCSLLILDLEALKSLPTRCVDAFLLPKEVSGSFLFFILEFWERVGSAEVG